MALPWTEQATSDFTTIIQQLPQFHRTIAERLVKEKSEELAASRGAAAVEEEDVIRAFFQEVPPAFKDMMKRLFSKHRIDYTRYCKE